MFNEHRVCSTFIPYAALLFDGMDETKWEVGSEPGAVGVSVHCG